MIGVSARMSDKRLRCGDIVFGVGICGFEKEISRGDARATAAALISRRYGGKTHPCREGISRSIVVVIGRQGIVQRIVDELRELLGERLNIAVCNNTGRVMEIGPEHEGVSCSLVDAVRSPGTAFGCIVICVVGGVARHGDDELAILFRKLLEDLLLQKYNIHDGKGSTALL